MDLGMFLLGVFSLWLILWISWLRTAKWARHAAKITPSATHLAIHALILRQHHLDQISMDAED